MPFFHFLKRIWQGVGYFSTPGPEIAFLFSGTGLEVTWWSLCCRTANPKCPALHDRSSYIYIRHSPGQILFHIHEAWVGKISGRVCFVLQDSRCAVCALRAEFSQWGPWKKKRRKKRRQQPVLRQTQKEFCTFTTSVRLTPQGASGSLSMQMSNAYWPSMHLLSSPQKFSCFNFFLKRTNFKCAKCCFT